MVGAGCFGSLRSAGFKSESRLTISWLRRPNFRLVESISWLTAPTDYFFVVKFCRLTALKMAALGRWPRDFSVDASLGVSPSPVVQKIRLSPEGCVILRVIYATWYIIGMIRSNWAVENGTN